VLLCYLPLCHTFGRYLELLGSLFWGGTYVFAGNPSLETLLAGLRQVRPTGLVSIPLAGSSSTRGASGASAPSRARERRNRRPPSSRWPGAARLGPFGGRILRALGLPFFQRSGVALCSGFGMTEATAGSP